MLVLSPTSSLIITMSYPKVQPNGQATRALLSQYAHVARHMVTSLRMPFVMMISWWHHNHVTREECWMRVSYGRPHMKWIKPEASQQHCGYVCFVVIYYKIEVTNGDSTKKNLLKKDGDYVILTKK